MANRWGTNGNSDSLYSLGLQNHCRSWLNHKIKRCLLFGRKVMTNLRWHIKNQRHYFANKGPSSQSYGFLNSHIWMWELDHKESWALKNGCFWTVVLEKTLESPLDCKEIQPVHPKGNQSWIFIGRTDAEAEIPVFWPADEKSWLLGKDPDAGKDWRREEKGTTEMRLLDGNTDSMDMCLSKLQELVVDREVCVLQSMGSQWVGHDWATELYWSDDPITILWVFWVYFL